MCLRIVFLIIQLTQGAYISTNAYRASVSADVFSDGETQTAYELHFFLLCYLHVNKLCVSRFDTKIPSKHWLIRHL
jgi:hypothetical protein